MNGDQFEKKSGAVSHYYGDSVRMIFIGAALLMMLTMPYFTDLIPVPFFISILIICLISIVAGLTNPLQRWVAVLNFIFSIVGLISFQYYAVHSFETLTVGNPFFWINQILALAFLFALYFSSKTLRGRMVVSFK